LPLLSADHPVLLRFKARRCATLEDIRRWVEDEHGLARTSKDKHGQAEASSVIVRESPCSSVSFSSPTLVANAALSLLNLACHLLDRQLLAQAQAFENEGGFTERLYRVRTAKRKA
jgi:four helix bundle suffix protein